MFRVIRSSHRPTTLMMRVTAVLPDLAHPHRKRHRRMSAAAIVRAVAGLVAVLVGIAAVVFRNKLVAIVSRGDGGEDQASDAVEHKLASIASNGGGGEEQAPVPAEK